MSEEEWRPIPGWDYQVSSYGRVRSEPRTVRCIGGSTRVAGGRVLVPNRRRGQDTVMMSRAGEKRTVAVHRLVLEAFVGPRPDGMEGCHNNGNPHDNRAVNLRWDTHRNNLADRERHGTMPRGENAGRSAKLTEFDIRCIRSCVAAGLAQVDVAKLFDLSRSHVSAIVQRKTWSHVIPTPVQETIEAAHIERTP